MKEKSKYSYRWYTKQFTQAKKRAITIQDSVNKQILSRKPSPDSWSAAQCIAHLNEFGNIYFDTIQQGIVRTGSNAASKNSVFKPRLFWRGVVRIFEPPYRMKLKTISIFEPESGEKDQSDNPFEDFRKLQDRFIDQIENCRDRSIDLDATKVPNPALSFLKMTLAECYAVVDAHQRRHLWQAEQVLDKLHSVSST